MQQAICMYHSTWRALAFCGAECRGRLNEWDESCISRPPVCLLCYHRDFSFSLLGVLGFACATAFTFVRFVCIILRLFGVISMNEIVEMQSEEVTQTRSIESEWCLD